MPVVFRQDGFHSLFYSNEGDPREPVHVHAVNDGVDAKFWLRPDVKLVYNDGFSARTLRELTGIIEQRRGEIEGMWNDFFSES